MNKDLTHINKKGEARMVDVSSKAASKRTALAQSRVKMKAETLSAIKAGNNKKGNVLETARLAGIMAAKKTAELIPLCHPLALTSIAVELELKETEIIIHARVEAFDRTGVEMEALIAASIAALTIYDMAKALDKGMVIEATRLLEKTGGKSGNYKFGEL